MFIRSVSLAVLAFAASVSAQTTGVPNHTYFTNPVTNDLSFPAGENATFSWQTACVEPSSATSPNPTKVEVHLVNSNDSNNAYYVAAVTTIDCTQMQGNQDWLVPEKFEVGTYYSLKFILEPTPVYSGKFKIFNRNAPTAGSAAGTTDTSAAGVQNSQTLSTNNKASGNGAGHLGTPAFVLSGAALAASAALMFL